VQAMKREPHTAQVNLSLNASLKVSMDAVTTGAVASFVGIGRRHTGVLHLIAAQQMDEESVPHSFQN
jgi:hypothetical protein